MSAPPAVEQNPPSRAPIPLAERRRAADKPIPREGENGEFSQSWFPICLTSEVEMGQIIGRDFLDGRVIVYRGTDGVARVHSAYCPHLGADLPPPPLACLYTFPLVERFGIIYVFNGHQPLWQITDFDYADDDLVHESFISDDYQCDPWIFASNTPDTQHIAVVHGFRFKGDDPMKMIDWQQWGFRMKIEAFHRDNEELAWEVGIFGTSTFFQQGKVDDWWLGMDHGKFLLARTAAEDKPILDSIHHRVGYLIKADTALARYFDFLRQIRARIRRGILFQRADYRSLAAGSS